MLVVVLNRKCHKLITEVIGLRSTTLIIQTRSITVLWAMCIVPISYHLDIFNFMECYLSSVENALCVCM